MSVVEREEFREDALVVEVLDRVHDDGSAGPGRWVRVRPRGAVVASTVDHLTAELDRACDSGGAVLVIDLSSVTIVDPAGLAVLAGRSAEPVGLDARCVLTGPSAAVRSLLGKKPRRRTGRARRDNADAAWLTAHSL